MHTDMTPRQEEILASVVKEYIDTAEPIGSKMLETSGNFGVSSATIRSEMHELEQLGYLDHPHTSAGRIPTEKAYKHLINNLTEKDIRINHRDAGIVSKQIIGAGDSPQNINKAVAKTLSDLSGSLAITNIIGRDDFYKTGLSELLGLPEFREFDRISRMTNFFDEFDRMFDDLAHDFFGNDFNDFFTRPRPFNKIDHRIKVFIGRENPIKEMHDATVMATQFRLPGNYIGSLTLIGPMRMNYGRNIGLMKHTTDTLNNIY